MRARTRSVLPSGVGVAEQARMGLQHQAAAPALFGRAFRHDDRAAAAILDGQDDTTLSFGIRTQSTRGRSMRFGLPSSPSSSGSGSGRRIASGRGGSVR